MKWPGWEHQLLSAMDAMVTNERVYFLRAWQECEGGTARFNPLNTTLKLQGSTPYNSAGVQHYEDRMQGLAATLLTIRLPYYSALRKALHSPNLSAPEILAASRSDISTWGTNPSCIRSRL